MKKTSRWAFENVWLIYSIVAMGLVNWAIALATVPQPFTVYSRAGWLAVAMALGFGMIWGLANVFFGMGIHLVGISLAFPIAMGVSTALGSLIPLAASPAVFLSPGGIVTAVSVAVILSGVACCGLAGIARNARMDRPADFVGKTPAQPARRQLIMGLAIVLLAGVTDPFLNFAFNFGDRIKEEALVLGACRGSESDAIWALALTGSLLVNAIYCGVLLTRNGSWRRFTLSGTGHYWGLAALMGLAWMPSITLYGRGAAAMGSLGGSVGWAVFYSCIMVFSTLWGLVTGEWCMGHGRPLRMLTAGLTLLLLAIVLLGYGSSLPTDR